MRKLLQLWRSVFDVRPGEYLRLLFMFLYLTLTLFAYYILKPASRALFLNKFDVDRLPFLTIIVAIMGGILAYGYTKLAVRYSLPSAVRLATIISIGSLMGIWWLLRFKFAWTIYVFNVWLSLFSITMVSQGWLVAGNVFNPREAKRLYGILGGGALLGAALGGSFTALVVKQIGTNNLLIVTAGMVVLAYMAFLAVARLEGVSLDRAKVTEGEESFAFRDILMPIRQYRHLQVIIGIITITYMVDTMIDFQFSAMAQQAYQGDALTAFLGSFFGLYLNLVTFALQFFLTSFVAGRFGVGGTLQIMPIAIAVSSAATLISPSVLSTAAARLAEASTRYSFNRTGMELLYLPLPIELRNRTKAFVDIFTDRMARGVAGLLLILLTTVIDLEPRWVSVVTLGLSGVWVALSHLARREYVATVRSRLAARRLDLESARVTVPDAATTRVLEETLESDVPRQVSYALSMLGEVPRYPIQPVLMRLAGSPSAEVRGTVYELACQRRIPGLLDAALAELRGARPDSKSEALKPATQYALAVSPEARELAQRLLNHAHPAVAEATIEALGHMGETAQELLTHDWLQGAVQRRDPRRRALAAIAVQIRGDEGTEALHHLLADTDPQVQIAAAQAAGKLHSRAYLHALLNMLAAPRLRGTAVEALGGYGDRILGTLADLLHDQSVTADIRRQLPRVLRLIPTQRSVDLLFDGLHDSDLTLRANALRALNRLRESAPQLNFGPETFIKLVLNEARAYYELHAALVPFRDAAGQRSAAGLLARTLDDRLGDTLERLFRLLGLKYPPREIHAAYKAVHRRSGEEYSAALEFLDSVLERELKKVLLPLIDEDARIAEYGQDLFGVQVADAGTALRQLMRSGDPWLASCAIATAVELNMRELARDIAPLSAEAGKEVGAVARKAVTALA